MGADADEPLIKWIGNPRHRDDLALQKELILSLGRTRTKQARRELHELLTDHRPTFIAAAAKAMGNFTFEPSKVRKELFEDLLKALLQAQSNAENSDSTAMDVWRAMRGPTIASMRALSGASVSSPSAWQHWWNKNKRRDWDE
jgi:hypothetical protein